MKIIWVSTPTEIELDIDASLRGVPGLTYKRYSVGKPCLAHTAPSFVGSREIIGNAKLDTEKNWVPSLKPVELLKHLGEAEKDTDMFIFRYPYWIQEMNLKELFNSQMGNKPAVAWCSEQGPMRERAAAVCEQFKIIAVNNRIDQEWYMKKFPKKKILYLPSGCCELTRFASRSAPIYDLIADGGAHYNCRSQDDSACTDNKHISVDTLVMPVINRNIVFYGSDNTRCGWGGVPGALLKFKGSYFPDKYPDIYSNAKIYLGISWNWRFGGYGIKLARALSTGIMVIWHSTLGSRLEGLIPGYQLEFSDNPKDTVALVDYYLSHAKVRHELAERGRRWSIENWEWKKNLVRLTEAVHRCGI